MSSPVTDHQTAAPQKRRMSTRARILFFAVAWAIVLMPFLFWRGTWFGRPLSDADIQTYLHDDAKPRHIQHALVQIGERTIRHDAAAARWYPDVVRISSHPVEEIRNTDAWVMGQDTSRAEFHQALLKMLNDLSPTVRGNAALGLVRFGDASGHQQIVDLLQPAKVFAPQTGKITDTGRAGNAVHQLGVVAKLQTADGQTVEVRSPISGRIRSLSFQEGDNVSAGIAIATIDPGEDQVWEALRALDLIGRAEDIPAIQSFQKPLPDLSDRVRQQALATEKEIRRREGQ